MFFVSRCLWTCLWTCLFFRFFVAVPVSTKLTVRGSQLFAWEENGVSFRICIALGWPSHHFAPFVMFVLSVLSLVYHWFVCFIALGLYVSVISSFLITGDHQSGQCPTAMNCFQRSLRTSKCRFFLRWFWAASAFLCWKNHENLKVWIHGDSAWLCLHCLQGLEAVMTYFQHANIGPTWSMVGHLDPANLDSVAIEK